MRLENPLYIEVVFNQIAPDYLEGLFKQAVLFFSDQGNKSSTYIVDALWGQPIKLIQVVPTSEFHEY